MRFSFLLSAAASLVALAVPAQAVIPIYGNPGTQNPQNLNGLFAGGSSSLRTWFVGKGGAVFTSRLGAIVNGVDRGFGLNNQTSALGELFNYGKITAGDSIEFYLSVADTGRTYSNTAGNNSDGVQHFFRAPYLGGDFGIPLTPFRQGTYFGVEDIEGGGDFNYTDLQFIARTGSIPEPENWALMIAGFGLVGAAARRRAKVQVTYA
jgi:hypothetical protein